MASPGGGEGRSEFIGDHSLTHEVKCRAFPNQVLKGKLVVWYIIICVLGCVCWGVCVWGGGGVWLCACGGMCVGVGGDVGMCGGEGMWECVVGRECGNVWWGGNVGMCIGVRGDVGMCMGVGGDVGMCGGEGWWNVGVWVGMWEYVCVL